MYGIALTGKQEINVIGNETDKSGRLNCESLWIETLGCAKGEAMGQNLFYFAKSLSWALLAITCYFEDKS